MNKFNSIKGFKRYVFAGSLILPFLGTLFMTSNVFANACIDRKQYTCTAVETCGGEITDSWEMCTSLCIQNDEYAYLDAAPYFHCNLGFVNSKELLGSGASIIEGGCSVNFKGRSMIVDYIPLIGATGCKYHFQCTPCDGCCSGQQFSLSHETTKNLNTKTEGTFNEERSKL